MALDEKNVYALDAGKNSFLTMTKEQILAAITQAVSTGEIKDIDAGFVTKLQEMNKQGVLQVWVGTMAEFEALEEKREDMLYLFTDDPTVTDIEGELKNLETQIKNIVDGNTVVKKAEAATTADKATNALKINDMQLTRSDDGVLKIGDVIIPQKKLIYTGTTFIRSATITLTEAIKLGDTLEVHCTLGNDGAGNFEGIKLCGIVVTNDRETEIQYDAWNTARDSKPCGMIRIHFDLQEDSLNKIAVLIFNDGVINHGSDLPVATLTDLKFRIDKIYKVIQ